MSIYHAIYIGFKRVLKLVKIAAKKHQESMNKEINNIKTDLKQFCKDEIP